MLAKLFALRGTLDKRTTLTIEIVGMCMMLIVWHMISLNYPVSILPSPWEVLVSFKVLHYNDFLIENVMSSLKLNYLAYIIAILIAVPLGFVLGMFPVTKALANQPIAATRFIPLTAITGLFIAWFGIDFVMKTSFLAFGIIVYLLPVVVQRVVDLEDVYVQTVHTLGGTTWQKIYKVFIPGVFSKLFDDIRVIVAMSWTYIIVAEMVNSNSGVGKLIFVAQRQSHLDKVFAILLVIIAIGFLQDKLFKLLDVILFKHKYQK